MRRDHVVIAPDGRYMRRSETAEARLVGDTEDWTTDIYEAAIYTESFAVHVVKSQERYRAVPIEIVRRDQ